MWVSVYIHRGQVTHYSLNLFLSPESLNRYYFSGDRSFINVKDYCINLKTIAQIIWNRYNGIGFVRNKIQNKTYISFQA